MLAPRSQTGAKARRRSSMYFADVWSASLRLAVKLGNVVLVYGKQVDEEICLLQ
jgi:hypothetical protein